MQPTSTRSFYAPDDEDRAINAGIAGDPDTFEMSDAQFLSVFDAIADTPEQSVNLQARAELMQQIAGRIQANDWTQAQAATACGVTQPRINDLLRGRVSKFSLDALVNIATALGCRVHVILEAA